MEWALHTNYTLPSVRTEVTNEKNLFPILFGKEEGAATGIEVTCELEGDIPADEEVEISARLYHYTPGTAMTVPADARRLITRRMEESPPPAHVPGHAPSVTFVPFKMCRREGPVQGLVHVWHPAKVEVPGGKQRPLYLIGMVATRSNREESACPYSDPFVWQVKASDSSCLYDENNERILNERLKPYRQTGGHARIEIVPRLRAPEDDAPPAAAAGQRRVRSSTDEEAAATIVQLADSAAGVLPPAGVHLPIPSGDAVYAPRTKYATSDVGAPAANKRSRLAPSRPAEQETVAAPSRRGGAAAVPAEPASHIADAVARTCLIFLSKMAASANWYADMQFKARLDAHLESLPADAHNAVSELLFPAQHMMAGPVFPRATAMRAGLQAAWSTDAMFVGVPPPATMPNGASAGPGLSHIFTMGPELQDQRAAFAMHYNMPPQPMPTAMGTGPLLQPRPMPVFLNQGIAGDMPSGLVGAAPPAPESLDADSTAAGTRPGGADVPATTLPRAMDGLQRMISDDDLVQRPRAVAQAVASHFQAPQTLPGPGGTGLPYTFSASAPGMMRPLNGAASNVLPPRLSSGSSMYGGLGRAGSDTLGVATISSDMMGIPGTYGGDTAKE